MVKYNSVFENEKYNKKVIKNTEYSLKIQTE